MDENLNTLRKDVEKLYKESRFQEIIALLTEKELEKQRDAVLYTWRARVAFQLQKKYIAETMVFAEKAIILDPTYYMGYYARALAWFDRNEYLKAIKDFTKSIELNLNFADAYYYRGLVWQNLNDYNKAIAEFDKAILNYNKLIQINPNDAELYLYRGNAKYNKTDYKNAIKDFSKAIVLNKNFADAHYNRGLANYAIEDYPNAIEDYSKSITLKPEYADVYYFDRANAHKRNNDNKNAIADYTKAIKKNPKYENAYYFRGLARKESKVDNDGSKQDFKKYLKLTSEDDDVGVRYAKYYLKKLEEINDLALSEISDIVFKIKEILRIDKDDCITHYTGLSVIKCLILDCNKFRISEGNFMNDPSEGMEFFDFLEYNPFAANLNDSVKPYSPKPFIGSFVTKDKNNDLNMWRFYGKEEGVEAKGCAIDLCRQKFIDVIKNSLSNEKNKEARIDDESDINFYWVVYLRHKSTDFSIPNLDSKKFKEFKGMMDLLKRKVTSYKEVKGANIPSLEEYLNNIAFLFKRDDYKNENEVRLVMNGIEFEKKFYKEEKSVNPPRVYIELAPINKIVEKVILGPKVDKVNEWASALHFSYNEKEKAPKIEISHLPYK